MIRSIGAILFIALLAVGCSAEVTGPNRAPHAEAGADQVTEVGRPVLLDGSKSWDPDGDPINHTWDLVAAPDGAITSALTTHGETATLNPPVPGVWLVRLVVTDGKLDSEPDIVQVRVMKSCTDEGPYGDPTCTDGVDNDCDDATDADDTDCWCTSDNDCDSGQLCRLIDGVCVDDLCDPNPCNGRGTCDDATGQAVCTCETGYTGNTCNTCDTGYHPVGNDCVVDEVCQANSCSGHGTCSTPSGVIECSCDTGYTGVACSSCDTGYHEEGGDCVADEVCQPDSCNFHGTCSTPSGVIECSCNPEYQGSICDECAAGYHWEGNDCVLDQNCQPNTCNGHGQCDDVTGVPVCTCDTGYTGVACSSCDTGYHPVGNDCVVDEVCQANSCSGHGTCSTPSGVIECTCETGYTGNTCNTCDTGYHPVGNDCVVDEVCQANSCSGHGTCSTPSGVIECSCDTGYTGVACSSCDTGYHEEGGDCVADEVCQPDSCNFHGTCSTPSGVIECTCETGYTGAVCDACDVGYHDEGGVCVSDWPYESRLVFALTAGETPSIQNGGESDVLFFSVTAQDGPAGISVMTFQVTCPNGQVSEAAGEGKLYRSFDGQTYNAITIAGQGAVARYIPDANQLRIGFVQEELFAEGETKYYRLSPVMSGLALSEQCSVTMLSNAAAGPAFLYHPSETSLLSMVDGVCYESPPNFIWSDLSAGANHLHSTVDFWPCALLEGAEPQPWGSDDYIAGAVNAGVVQVTVTAP